MKKLFSLVSLLFFLPVFMLAQDDICIGKQYKIYSESLGEEREYQVYLPASYGQKGNAAKYPVIYLLDGEMYFHILTAIHRSYSRGRMSLMPESIIIGIINTDRTRDLTPSASAYRRDGTIQQGDKETGGGADTFIRFITGELREKIDKDYNTNGTNTLIGHSFGGLFTLNALLHHTDKFDTYIALDPSLWWDNAKLAKDAVAICNVKQFNGKKLYIGIAGKMRVNTKNIHQNTLDVFINETLSTGKRNGLIYHTKFFPEENHGSIVIPGLIDAFRQLYTSRD